MSVSSPSTVSSWGIWSKIYSNRNDRLLLYCRDPQTSTPCDIRSIIVSGFPINIAPHTVLDTFSKCGRIIKHEFPEPSLNDSAKSCIFTFETVSEAKHACQMFNRRKFYGFRLEVKLYNLADEYVPQKLQLSDKCGSLEALEDENCEHVIGYLRQAQLQEEQRSNKLFHKKRLRASTMKSPETKNGERKRNSRNDDDLSRVFEHSLKMYKNVDDLGLDNATGFWEWLKARLNFTGPLYFTHEDIIEGVQKLPPLVQREFSWILGSLRLADSAVFSLIGPYICLKQHSYYAKEKCKISCQNYDDPFTECWEPFHPSNIESDRQIVAYARAMLIKFGPLPILDGKIGQFLELVNRCGNYGDVLSSDNLRWILEKDYRMTIIEDAVYLTKEHEHLLGRIRAENWLVSAKFL